MIVYNVSYTVYMKNNPKKILGVGDMACDDEHPIETANDLTKMKNGIRAHIIKEWFSDNKKLEKSAGVKIDSISRVN